MHVREAAFGEVLPTLVLQAQHVASVFSQQLDEDLVLSSSDYLAMVQHYLDGEASGEVNDSAFGSQSCFATGVTGEMQA